MKNIRNDSFRKTKKNYKDLKYTKIINSIIIVAALIIFVGGIQFLLSDYSHRGSPPFVTSFIFLLIFILPLDLIVFIPWFIWFLSQLINHGNIVLKNNLYILIITILIFIYTVIHFFAIVYLT